MRSVSIFKMHGKGDPGYKITSLLVTESALCLVENTQDLPGGSDYGGILTSASGLGGALISRLKNAGIVFEGPIQNCIRKGMKILRTPDERFEDIKGYPFEPHYTNITTDDGSELRIHHIDEGPKDGPILLAMHGQPVWSYLYSRMIPFLNSAGIRVIAPDLPGYGKSDKPAAREDYSYQRQVDWMGQWLSENDLSDITFFGQDWGGLIGLRMVAQDPDRFIKVSIGNTGLPYNPNVPQEVIDEIKAFRASDEKLTMMGMAKEVRKMDGKSLSEERSWKTHPALKFMYWQKFCWDTENLPIGLINSFSMEKRSKISLSIEYFSIELVWIIFAFDF